MPSTEARGMRTPGEAWDKAGGDAGMRDRWEEPYCHMSGHAERGCPSDRLDAAGNFDPRHQELCRQGFGFAVDPDPMTGADVDAEGLAMRRRLPHQQ